MEKTWMPKVAGILDIVAGALGIIISFVLALVGALFPYLATSDPAEFHDFPAQLFAIWMIGWAVFLIVAGILAIVGGIYALRREKWGLALAGSIGALFGSSPLGVAAIIFTALSKKEFE